MTTAVLTPHSCIGRLSLCRDILKLRAGINRAVGSQSVNARVLGERRIAAIRQVLLDRASRDLVDEVLTPSVGYAALKGVMDAVEGEPEVVRVRTALYVGEMIKMLRGIDAGEVRAGLSTEQQPVPTDLLEQVMMTISLTSSEHADELADAAISAGKFNDDMRKQASGAAAGREKSEINSLRIEDIDPQLHAQVLATLQENEEIYKRHSDLALAYSDLRFKVMRGLMNGHEDEAQAELERLNAEKNKAWDDYVKHRDQEVVAIRQRSREVVAKARAEIEEPFADVGRKAIESVLSSSEVSQEQADTWAQGQEITKTAAARLKKLGYPIEKVRQDMAEFYRFTGGRVTKVKIDSKGDRRANATQISDHTTSGKINLGSSFDKRVLWHEMAHHIESDPVARMAAGRLVKRRSVDGQIHKLRTITGNNGYNSKEVGYKDHFFDAYVGKVYKDGMTEVFSMGAESFTNPVTLGKRIAQDPQTLEFVAGYLKQPLDPIAKAFIKMRDAIREVNEDSIQGHEADTAELLKALAKGVSMTDDKDSSWVVEKGWDYYVKGKQIGFFYDSTNGTNWYVFSTQVRNHSTGRKMLGYGLYCPRPTGEIGANGKPRYSLGRSEYATKDMDVVKAAFAIYRKTGAFPTLSDLNNGDFLRKQVSQ